MLRSQSGVLAEEGIPGGGAIQVSRPEMERDGTTPPHNYLDTSYGLMQHFSCLGQNMGTSPNNSASMFPYREFFPCTVQATRIVPWSVLRWRRGAGTLSPIVTVALGRLVPVHRASVTRLTA